MLTSMLKAQLNAHATRFLVDTGLGDHADRHASRGEIRNGRDRAAWLRRRRRRHLVEVVNPAGVKELAIGIFKLANAKWSWHTYQPTFSLEIGGESNAGVLGEDYCRPISRSSTWRQSALLRRPIPASPIARARPISEQSLLRD